MAFCSNHDHLYFDRLCRTKKAETVLSLIHASYQAKINNGDKAYIAKNLLYAYYLFKFDVGSYTGDVSQFESQYTIGHELGIWKNSELELNDLANDVAQNKITIREYFDVFFLNYIQPIDNKIVHPLYSILEYMKLNDINDISKDDLRDVFSFVSMPDKNEINGLFNMLLGTSYFSYENSKTLHLEGNVNDLLTKCNLSRINEDYEKIKKEFSDLTKYTEYLISRNNEVTNLSTNEWIISANPNVYNYVDSFKKNGAIEWHQNANLNVGDIVFVYTSKPIQRITNITKVTDVNIKKDDRKLDDSAFWKDKSDSDEDRFMRLELINDLDYSELELECLKHHGLKNAPQGPMRLNSELSSYIHSIIDKKCLPLAFNKIYYGIPGCGKSHQIEHEDLVGVDKEKDVFRTTFYLDYSNSDFIGQIYPSVENIQVTDSQGEIKYKDQVTYKRIPGPFTEALSRAYSEQNKMIYLVIEEINRGNAAAIFGDLFQLLDRLDEEWDGRLPGDSEYPINNEFIEGYLNEKHVAIPYGQDKIFIPHNLIILATMNTSDQNVFPLDTAFKRRWDRERIVPDWDEAEKYFDNLYIPFTDHTWIDFADAVNKKMVSRGDEGIVLEDKKLGPFFIKKELLVEKECKDLVSDANKKRLRQFVNNVIDYLYSDVTKFEHDLLFNNNPSNYDVVYNSIIKFEDGKFVGDKNLALNVFDSNDRSEDENEESEDEESKS